LTRYSNLEPIRIGAGFWRWQRERRRLGLPHPPLEGYAAFAERWSMKPDFALGSPLGSAQNSVWWLGHATVLLRVGDLHVITDPHLSQRASPLPFLGPRRLVPAPAAATELPKIDLALISHNHYDHLDRASIRALLRCNPATVFLAPLGLATWLRRCGALHVHELGWWQKHEHETLEIHCVPAQHWSARGLFDRYRTLWCGWMLRSGSFSFYFSGDTGYTPRLADISMRLGPPDLAALPIGAYAPRWFMGPQHIDPPEAIRLHRELGVKRSLAIHWGTFELADDRLDEPVARLQEVMVEQDLSPRDFWVIRQGEGRRL
jgi:L-ascorbate metabolism protein UlaG (beta-lactamase superfamily)